jgi:hypothetical protein
MNERVKELAEQAYEQQPLMIANPVTFEIEHKIGNGGVPMYHKVFNQEKFAELIVKECADTAYQSLYEDRVFDDTPHNIRCHVMDVIKEHFGVEE